MASAAMHWAAACLAACDSDLADPTMASMSFGALASFTPKDTSAAKNACNASSAAPCNTTCILRSLRGQQGSALQMHCTAFKDWANNPRGQMTTRSNQHSQLNARIMAWAHERFHASKTVCMTQSKGPCRRGPPSSNCPHVACAYTQSLMAYTWDQQGEACNGADGSTS